MVDQAKVNGHAAQERESVTRNVADLAHDVITLAELQCRLLGADLREGAGKSRMPAVMLVTAPILALAALPVILFGCARGLMMATGWSEAAALVTVGGGALLLAGVLGWIGWSRLRSATRILSRSKREFTENLHWIKTALSPSSRGTRR